MQATQLKVATAVWIANSSSAIAQEACSGVVVERGGLLSLTIWSFPGRGVYLQGVVTSCGSITFVARKSH